MSFDLVRAFADSEWLKVGEAWSARGAGFSENGSPEVTGGLAYVDLQPVSLVRLQKYQSIVVRASWHVTFWGTLAMGCMPLVGYRFSVTTA